MRELTLLLFAFLAIYLVIRGLVRVVQDDGRGPIDLLVASVTILSHRLLTEERE